MSDEQPQRRLAGDEIEALRFAGRRQLTRWSSRRDELSPHEREQRAALITAIGTLATFADEGCELRAIGDG